MVTTAANDPDLANYLATAGMGFDPGEMHRFRRDAPVRHDARLRLERSFGQHQDQSLGTTLRFWGA
ncbi:MAG: hypothetical protein AAGF94_01350 [Pseudomonadota bacterium]